MTFVSIQLNSNRPQQIATFFYSIEATADTPGDIEVLLHIDKGDVAMEQAVVAEQQNRRFSLRVLQTDLVKGYATLWKPLNLLFEMTAPDAYFVINLSDEMLFKTQGWDTIIRQYVGYYPDHIFRLRASKYRFRNYTDFWECGYAPDSLAFYTRRWLELGGDWNPCLGPDSFQQCVAFYLYTSDPFSRTQYNRDIALTEIEFFGEGAGKGLEGLAKYRQMCVNNRAWFILMSHRMQEEAKRRAMRLKSHIIAEAQGSEIVESISERNFHILEKETGHVIAKIFYGLSWLKTILVNICRMPQVLYYSGGGKRALRSPLFGCFVMFATYVPFGAYLLTISDELRQKFKHWGIYKRELARPHTQEEHPLEALDGANAIGENVVINETILFSIQISSSHPARISELLDNIECTADNPSRIEVLVHVETGDAAMKTLLNTEKTRRKVNVKCLDTGSLLLQHADLHAYFVARFSDEVRFETRGWDSMLKAYIGYYPDHIFRIRNSKYRFRNYMDTWECGFAPDNLTFYTRRWLDVQGNWDVCRWQNSFQQCVSYYLFTSDPYSHIQYHREIAAPFMVLSGGEAGLEENTPEWLTLMSHTMQENAKRKAMYLKATIIVLEMSPKPLVILDNLLARRIIITHQNGKPFYVLDYSLSRWRIRITKMRRALWMHYYTGKVQR